MASLHRHPKSPYWYCAYRLGDGRRTIRSTEETNRARAKVKCECFERIAEEESQPDTSRELLEGIVNDTLRRLGHATIVAAPTASEWLEKWLANERGAVAETTHKKYEQVIRGFFLSLGTRARVVKLSLVTPQNCIAYRDKLYSEGRSAGTANYLVRSILKRPFKIAVDSGIIDRNPVAFVRAIRSIRATKGTFTAEQVTTLIAIAEGW